MVRVRWFDLGSLASVSGSFEQLVIQLDGSRLCSANRTVTNGLVNVFVAFWELPYSVRMQHRYYKLRLPLEEKIHLDYNAFHPLLAFIVRMMRIQLELAHLSSHIWGYARAPLIISTR
jgi:hypothetical protein